MESNFRHRQSKRSQKAGLHMTEESVKSVSNSDIIHVMRDWNVHISFSNQPGRQILGLQTTVTRMPFSLVLLIMKNHLSSTLAFRALRDICRHDTMVRSNIKSIFVQCPWEFLVENYHVTEKKIGSRTGADYTLPLVSLQIRLVSHS